MERAYNYMIEYDDLIVDTEASIIELAVRLSELAQDESLTRSYKDFYHQAMSKHVGCIRSTLAITGEYLDQYHREVKESYIGMMDRVTQAYLNNTGTKPGVEYVLDGIKAAGHNVNIFSVSNPDAFQMRLAMTFPYRRPFDQHFTIAGRTEQEIDQGLEYLNSSRLNTVLITPNKMTLKAGLDSRLFECIYLDDKVHKFSHRAHIERRQHVKIRSFHELLKDV